MSVTTVGETIIPTPRSSEEAAIPHALNEEGMPTDSFDAPTQLRVETESGAEYFLDTDTQTVLARQKKDALFTYTRLISPILPKLEIGQLYNPTNSFGVGNRIVALASRYSHEDSSENESKEALVRIKETHVHARFLLDLIATK